MNDSSTYLGRLQVKSYTDGLRANCMSSDTETSLTPDELKRMGKSNGREAILVDRVGLQNYL